MEIDWKGRRSVVYNAEDLHNRLKQLFEADWKKEFIKEVMKIKPDTDPEKVKLLAQRALNSMLRNRMVPEPAIWASAYTGGADG
jgi:protein gp37